MAGGVVFARPAVTAAGGGGGGSDTLLAQVTLTNWDSSNASSTAGIFGHGFHKTDIPSGSIAVLKTSGDSDVSHSVFNQVYYDDGSLAWAWFTVQDSNIAASGSRTYRVCKRPSASYDSTTRSTTWAQAISAASNPRVAYSSVTETDDGGSRTHGAGAMLAKPGDVNTSYIDTRVNSAAYKHMTGEAYTKDAADGSGTADAHHKAIWSFDLFYDSGGSVIAIDLVPISCLAENAVASKKRLNYTATFLNDGGTIATYASKQHYYKGMWAACRTNDDNGSGRPHRLVGTQYTLYPTYDKSYLFDAECFFNGAYDPNFTATAATGDGEGSVTVFDPLSVQGQRGNDDAVALYRERGPMGNIAMAAFHNQGALDWRKMRVQGHVSLHQPQHVHPPVGSYPPSVITLRLDKEGVAGSASAWTGDGMPTAIYLCTTGTYDTGYDGGYVQAEGGTGPWSPSFNNSHCINPAIAPWLVEGNWHFLRALQEMSLSVTYRMHANIYGSHGRALFGGPEREVIYAYGIPTGQWSHVLEAYGQERDYGWGALRVAETFFTPAGAREKNFFMDWAAHIGEWLGTGISYKRSDHVNIEYAYVITSPWMQSIISTGFCTAAERFPQFQGWVDAADMYARLINGFTSRDVNRTTAYRGQWRKKSRVWNVTTNQWEAPADFLFQAKGVHVGGSTDTVTIPWEGVLANGDIFYPSDSNDSNTPGFAMPGVSEGTPYYAINTVNNGDGTHTCQLSTSPGGSKIDMTTGSDYWWLIDFKSDDTTDVRTGGGNEQYLQFAKFETRHQHNRNPALVDAANLTKLAAVTDNWDQSDFGQWKAVD